MSGNVRGGYLSQNSQLFTYFRCEGFFRPAGSKIGQNLFSIDELTISVTTDTLGKDNQQGPTAEPGAEIPLKSTVEGSITFGSLSEFALRSAFNSDESDGYLVQSAVNNGVFTIPQASVKKGGIYQILHPVSGMPIQNISGIDEDAATWGTGAGASAVSAVEGTDFMIDRRTGVLEILSAKPEAQTTAGDFSLAYAAAAISADKQLLRMGIGSAPGGKRGSMHFLALNEYGRQCRVDLWNTLITPDGGISLQATSEFSVSKAKIKLQSAQFFDGKPIPRALRFGAWQELDDTPLAA